MNGQIEAFTIFKVDDNWVQIEFWQGILHGLNQLIFSKKTRISFLGIIDLYPCPKVANVEVKIDAGSQFRFDSVSYLSEPAAECLNELFVGFYIDWRLKEVA
mmetsp:Transcript_18040/g.13072  ORF Transcript_18040/g.13072 Transcript_18040/m.13072 type:complete len:102 (-) Transcript_18040:1114-1419(-)